MNDMSEVAQAKLFEWMQDTTTIAFGLGHIGRHWRLSDMECYLLRKFYHEGLSPRETVEAIFATKH